MAATNSLNCHFCSEPINFSHFNMRKFSVKLRSLIGIVINVHFSQFIVQTHMVEQAEVV